MNKDELRAEFSEKRSELYSVELFKEMGFIRKRCKLCGRYFWTLDEKREYCPNQPCSKYEFIGNPSGEKLNYTEMWNRIRDFFVKNGHTFVKRYPVVARWRDDLYFTVASIIDFQRVEEGKVIFDFPANPLIVPQISIRFNDLANVGLTGRHFTSFCMVGQHALANREGYWKDRTVDLDYRLMAEQLHIPETEITFVEDVWMGYGAFGYSLEYFVKNLELGNAVFTEFEGSLELYKRFEPPVVDMGAGLERFVWLTNGTSTSYDAVFGQMVSRLASILGVEINNDLVKDFYIKAGDLDFAERSQSELLNKMLDVQSKDSILKLRDLYILLDHSRTLLFALVDGQLPSNVGGGYNLRVLMRRMFEILSERKWDISVYDLLKWNAEYLKPMYPELSESVDNLKEIIDVEKQRYHKLEETTTKMLEKYRKSKVNIEEAAKLYESNGISPELLFKQGLIDMDPAEVLLHVTSKHERPETVPPKPAFSLDSLAETEQLYYDNIYNFKAKVLKVENGYVILDKTAFYPRSGGQEPDRGKLNEFEVEDVVKIRGVIGHKVQGIEFVPGEMVNGEINIERRRSIMRHHTATHIINAAARMVLGPWVWQNSAFKEENRARLDITHHSALSEQQIKQIEEKANRIVLENIKVEKLVMDRLKAESEFGFRIYQGGVVPGNKLRIIKIGNYDVEACGGTHVDYTGQIGFIKILKAERIQDGVDRIEFVAGVPAIKFIQNMEDTMGIIKQMLKVPEYENIPKSIGKMESELKSAKAELEVLLKNYINILSRDSPDILLINEPWVTRENAVIMGNHYAINGGAVFIALWHQQNDFGYIIITGNRAEERGITAESISEELNNEFSGTGGGRGRFAQGIIRNLKNEKLYNIIEKHKQNLK
ncbi:MAG: alanine--tRNA ligase [Conexivisphaerales archaeon]